MSETDTGNKEEAATVEQARHLRLESLQTSPDSFGSTFDGEVSLPLDSTRARLSKRSATHFVAVMANEEFRESNSNWVGLVVSHMIDTSRLDDGTQPGMNPWERTNERSNQDGLILSDIRVENLNYQYNGLFVRPTARGLGMGEGLLRAAMEDARQHGIANGAHSINHSVAVFADNLSAKTVYEKVGFVEVSRESHEPRPRDGVRREKRDVLNLECRTSIQS